MAPAEGHVRVDDITRMRRKKAGRCPTCGADLVPRWMHADGTTTWMCDSGLVGAPICGYRIRTNTILD